MSLLPQSSIDKAIADDGQGKELSGRTLAMLTDAFWEIKTKRLDADKTAAALKAKETKLEGVIVNQLRQQEMSTVGGKTISLQLKKEDAPQVENWEQFYAHILETKDFSLLERRVGRAAVKERWEDQQTVPGVIKFPVYKLSKSQVKG